MATIRKETISIKTFGSSNESTHKCELLNLKIVTRDGGSVKITTLCVPLICEPIHMQPIHRSQDTLGYLSDLDLADIPTNGYALEVGALLGSDYYQRFATGRVLRGRARPTAVHT